MSYLRKGTNQQKRNKQTYLSANSQFLVLNGYDATIHQADPDWPVDWDAIEEVQFKQSLAFLDKLACPICLDGPPSAAKITRCGHIYCWTCMLEYFSQTIVDRNQHHKPCPICFEPVHKEDLRSVLFQTYIDYSIGDEIELKLMMRDDGYVSVNQYSSDIPQDVDVPESNSGIDRSQVFGNLVVVGPEYILENTIKREHKELTSSLEESIKNSSDTNLFDRALQDLSKRIERLNNLAASPKCNRSSSYPNDHPPIKRLERVESKKKFLFYQSSEGQHIYLNPFCTKILKHEYGKLELAPSKLKAKILHIDYISMDDFYRKRFKYLTHLPITCQFSLVELDFVNSNIVSDRSIKVFETEIIRRDLERRRRRKEERKRDKKWQEEQKRKIYGVYGYGLPCSRIDLNNLEQFPAVSDERSSSRHGASTSNIDEYDYYLDYFSSEDEAKSIEINQAESTNQPIDHDNSPSIQETMTLGLVIQEEQMNQQGTLSFKDIQFEQERSATKPNLTDTVCNSWTRASNITERDAKTSQQTSSFAQLLVQTKLKPQVWKKATLVQNKQDATTSSAVSSSKPESPEEADVDEVYKPRPWNNFDLGDFLVKPAPSKNKTKRVRKNFSRNVVQL